MGWASPCLIVNPRISTAAFWITILFSSAASKICGRYLCTTAELTLPPTQSTTRENRDEPTLILQTLECSQQTRPYPRPLLASYSKKQLQPIRKLKEIRTYDIPFSWAACFADSELRKSCKILSNRPFASSSSDEKIWSINSADDSCVMRVGYALNKNPVRR
jgi:hypothetical protein